ncbi:MAG: ComF family protein [Lachnospiraceae bacterium]|nr:ComF family protein [Lachnospiraceae bacterium]
MNCEKLKRGADRILALIYPERCVFCDLTIGPSDGGICPGCRKSVEENTGPVCFKCGRRLKDEREELCDSCRKIRHAFDTGASVYPYSEKVVKSLYRLKYENRRRYALFYGHAMAHRHRDTVKKWGVDVIMPVPLHEKRLRSRGYNQAALSARVLGRELGIEVEEKALTRVKNTAALKLLDPAKRRDNLKNAFKISGYEVKLKSVLLVDDIYTTGSTVDEISKVLKAAGAQRVYFLTAAAGSD